MTPEFWLGSIIILSIKNKVRVWWPYIALKSICLRVRIGIQKVKYREKACLNRQQIIEEVRQRVKLRVHDSGHRVHLILYLVDKVGWSFFLLLPELKKIDPELSVITVDEINSSAQLFGRIEASKVSNKTNILITDMGELQHITPDVLAEVTTLGIISIFFHLDDDASFELKVRNRIYGPASIAHAVDLYLSSSRNSLAKYQSVGGRAIFVPEGSALDVFYPKRVPKEYDVVFIGKLYGRRPKLIEYLRRRGINVSIFGGGSQLGRVSFDEMNDIWNRSKIVLSHGGIGYSHILRNLKGRDFDAVLAGCHYVTTYHEELATMFADYPRMHFYESFEGCANVISELLKRDCSDLTDDAHQQLRIANSWKQRFLAVFDEIGVSVEDT